MYNVEIKASNDISIEEINSLRTLYKTPIGTIPMEREKGLDMSFLSMPKEVSKNMYHVELVKKTRMYSDNIEVSKVTFQYDENDKLTAKVVVVRGE